MATFPIRLKTRHFAGMSKVVYDGRGGHLAAILQGILFFLAQQQIQVARVPVFTDNSTGTAAYPGGFVNCVIPTAPFDASGSAVGAPSAGVNTALGLFVNAGAVIADTVNKARGRIGLPIITWASGTIATAATIPAQTTSFTAAQGTSAVDYATGVTAMQVMAENMKTLQDGINEVLYATGGAGGSSNKVIADLLTVPVASWSENTPNSPVLLAITNPSASVTGASSISNTVMNAFFAAVANNIATIAAFWNKLATAGTALTNLTDNSAGTATTVGAFALGEPNATPATATGAATTSVGKTVFDAQLVIYANAFSSLASRLNAVRELWDLAPITDNTGGTVSTTLAALSHALTAVDGSGAGVAANFADTAARMATVDNTLSSLAAAMNQVLAKVGIAPIADAGPLGVASTTLAALAATGAATGAAGQTMLNTAVNTWLQNSQNSVATLAAAINACTGSGMMLEAALPVVAVAG